MAYSIFVRFSSNLSAETTARLVLRDQDILLAERNNCEIILTSPDAVRTISILTFFRGISGIEKILVRDEDGWECEEIDLWTPEDLAGLSAKMIVSSTDSGMEETPSDSGRICSPQTAAPRLILASQSPRRQELLSLIGIPFFSQPADIYEDAQTKSLENQFDSEPFSIMAALIVMNLARAKARKLLDTNPDAAVIGSDTIVTIDTSILGKPSSAEDAFKMLRKLSWRDHHVYTGVSIMSAAKEETFFTVTRVGFFPWSKSEEDLALKYIAEGSPLDKAGEYGIQDMGALFIRGIKGDYYTVMGLPVSEVYRRLRDFGITYSLA